MFNQETGYHQITDISIILADVKLIKCKFDSLSFDISINNFVGLCKLIFIHHIESKAFNRLLFKRSLILIKSWCYYEGGVLGSNVGLLASYALEILLIYMFNNYSGKFTNEVGALFTFFKMMKDTDWDKSILSIFGCLNIDSFYENLKCYDFNLESLLKEMFDNKTSLIDFESTASLAKAFEKFAEMDKIQNFFSNKKAITTKYINIIDPMFQTNNLGKSVNYFNFSKIRKVFECVDDEVIKIKNAKSSRGFTPHEYLNCLLNFYNKTIINNSPELFNLYLLMPKIFIIPNPSMVKKEEVGDVNRDLVKVENNYLKDYDEEINYIPDNEIELLIKKFNEEFIIEENISNHSNITTENKNKESNLIYNDQSHSCGDFINSHSLSR